VLIAGLRAAVPSLGALVFVGRIALHLRGGRARFPNWMHLFRAAVRWRSVVTLGVRSCVGSAALFLYGRRVPLDLMCCVALRRAASAPCCPTACAPERQKLHAPGTINYKHFDL
jgi:hypothetical protein